MIKRPLEALRRWIRTRNTQRVLATLDDHLLFDIGLNRADLGFGQPGKLWRWLSA
jgi:uncharacterized protein YjiS (DUF1127 family)